MVLYKIFVSYAHANAVRAVQVFTDLVEAGQTVWMDEVNRPESEEFQDFVGVPAGQRHRDVIEQAIRESAAFVVVDSRAWRASQYCQEELAIARAAGKRVAVLAESTLPPLAIDGISVLGDDIDGLVARLEVHVDVALAHTRLEQTRQGVSHPHWVARLLGEPERLADATLLLSTEPAPDVPRPTPEQLAFATTVVETAQQQRRVRARVATGFVAVLSALVVLTSWAAVTAGQDAVRAEAASRLSRSLEASEQAIRGSGSQARALAGLAWALDQNSESRSAVSVTAAADRLLRVLPAPNMPDLKQLVSLPGGWFVASDGRRLVTLHAEDRETTTSENLPRVIGKTPLVASGHYVVAISRADDVGRRELYRYQFQTGEVLWSRLTGVTALGPGPDEAWLGYDDGSVGRYVPESDAVEVLGQANGPVTAIAATPHAVVALTADARVHSWERQRTDSEWTVDLARIEAPMPGADRAGPDSFADDKLASRLPTGDTRQLDLDRVVVCGDRVHVLVGSTHTGFPSSNHITLTTSGVAVTPFRSTPASSFACYGEGSLVGAGAFMTEIAVRGSDRGFPEGLLSMDDRFDASAVAATDHGFAVMTGQGELRISGTDPATVRNVGAASFVAPVADGFLLQDLTGGLWFVRGTEAAARLGTLNVPLGRSHALRDGVVATGGSRLYQLGSEGVVRHWPLADGITSIAISADGDTALLVAPKEITLRPLSEAPSRTVELAGLREDESARQAVMDGEDLYVWTSDNRLVRLDATGTLRSAWENTGLNRAVLAARPGLSEGVVVAGSDGVARVLDREFRLVAARAVGAVGALMLTSPDAGMVAVVLQAGRLMILDGETLEVRQVVSFAPKGPSDIQLSTDGRLLAVFEPYVRVRPSSNGVSAYVPEREYRTNATVTGVFPELAADQEDVPGRLTVVPICRTCAPT